MENQGAKARTLPELNRGNKEPLWKRKSKSHTETETASFSPRAIGRHSRHSGRLHRNGTTGMEYVNRHCQGDWGDLGKEDKQTNYEAVKKGERIFSAYALPDKTVIWIITERDRSVKRSYCPANTKRALSSNITEQCERLQSRNDAPVVYTWDRTRCG